MTLGELIYKYRMEQHLSQRAFAAKCGVSNVYISMIEKNYNPATGKPIVPSALQLKAIANAMGYTLDEITRMVDGDSVVKVDSWNPDEDLTWAEHMDETTRLMARGMSKMSPENREKLLQVARLMFAEDFDSEGYKKNEPTS